MEISIGRFLVEQPEDAYWKIKVPIFHSWCVYGWTYRRVARGKHPPGGEK